MTDRLRRTLHRKPNEAQLFVPEELIVTAKVSEGLSSFKVSLDSGTEPVKNFLTEMGAYEPVVVEYRPDTYWVRALFPTGGEKEFETKLDGLGVEAAWKVIRSMQEASGIMDNPRITPK